MAENQEKEDNVEQAKLGVIYSQYGLSYTAGFIDPGENGVRDFNKVLKALAEKGHIGSAVSMTPEFQKDLIEELNKYDTLRGGIITGSERKEKTVETKGFLGFKRKEKVYEDVPYTNTAFDFQIVEILSRANSVDDARLIDNFSNNAEELKDTNSSSGIEYFKYTSHSHNKYTEARMGLERPQEAITAKEQDAEQVQYNLQREDMQASRTYDWFINSDQYDSDYKENMKNNAREGRVGRPLNDVTPQHQSSTENTTTEKPSQTSQNTTEPPENTSRTTTEESKTQQSQTSEEPQIAELEKLGIDKETAKDIHQTMKDFRRIMHEDQGKESNIQIVKDTAEQLLKGQGERGTADDGFKLNEDQQAAVRALYPDIFPAKEEQKENTQTSEQTAEKTQQQEEQRPKETNTRETEETKEDKNNSQTQQSQTQDNNLNISQGKQDLVADQKRRRELIVKQNSTGGISPQEQEELNQLNKKLGKDSGGKATIKNDKNLAKDPKEETEEPKDIFKEEDILKYMYEEWLLGGANWLFKKSYKGVDWLAGKTAKGLWKGAGWLGSEVWNGITKTCKEDIKPLFKKEPPRDDSMTRFATALNNTHQESLSTKANTITGHLAEFGETLKRFSEGNISEEDKKTPLYALYQKVPENKRKDFCESMFTQATNATQNSLEVHRMAERLVSLRNLQSAMSNPNPQPLSPEMYKKEVNLMALVVARSISQSKDPTQAMGILNDNIEKSEQLMQAAFVNGNYKANGKNPEDNKKLNEQLGNTFKSVGLDGNGLITKEKEEKLQRYAYNDPNSKKDMLERLVMEQVAYSTIAQRQDNLQGQEAALAQRREEYREGRTNSLKRIYGLYAQRGDSNIDMPNPNIDDRDQSQPTPRPQPRPRPRAGNDGR